MGIDTSTLRQQGEVLMVTHGLWKTGIQGSTPCTLTKLTGEVAEW